MNADTPVTALAPTVPLRVVPAGVLFRIAAGSGQDARLRAVAWLRLPHVTPAGLCVVEAVHGGPGAPGDYGAIAYLPPNTPVRPLIGAATRSSAIAASSPAGHGSVGSDDDAYAAERELMRTGTPSLAAELDADARAARRR